MQQLPSVAQRMHVLRAENLRDKGGNEGLFQPRHRQQKTFLVRNPQSLREQKQQGHSQDTQALTNPITSGAKVPCHFCRAAGYG